MTFLSVISDTQSNSAKSPFSVSGSTRGFSSRVRKLLGDERSEIMNKLQKDKQQD